ncbi:MAG: recombinase family protein, partial [Candidatus Acidiferrales bacterium]
STVRVILHNERYLGKVIWSRKHKVRDPRTGRRVFRKREGELPIHGQDAPHLRIVSDELWNAVRERQELVKRVYEDANKRPGLLRSSAMNAPYLFSGLLRCSECGANLQIIAGRGRNHPNQTYGCPMNFHRGDSVCSNRVRVRRDVLESELLAGLQAKILREDIVNYVLDLFESELLRELANIGGEMDTMRKRKATLQAEVANLAKVVASGLHSPTVIDAIAEREREISEIGERLLSSSPDSIRSRVKSLRASALLRVRDLRECLNGDPAAARAYLTKHVEKIVMAPDDGRYVASGNWNLLGESRWDGAEGQS